MLLRLLLVAFLTFLGQGVALLIGRWLIVRHDAETLGSQFVQLNSTFQIAIISVSGMAAPALMHGALSIRNSGVPEQLRAMRSGVLLLSIAGAAFGMVFLLSNGVHPLLAVAVLPTAVLGISCESIHYGTGSAVRAAFWSAAKAVFVPLAFLLGVLAGQSVNGVFAAFIILSAISILAIRQDSIRTLGPGLSTVGIRNLFLIGLKTCGTGVGGALNGLQRVLPLLIVAPRLEAKGLADLFMFYSAFNVGYGGLRLTSQALFRSFGRRSLAEVVFWLSTILGAMTLTAVFAFDEYLPGWALPLVAVAIPATAFVGYHIRTTYRGDFVAYGLINGAATLGLLAICLVVRFEVAGINVIYVGAAFVELCCGISYWVLDRKSSVR